jgi:hypothetical protein
LLIGLALDVDLFYEFNDPGNSATGEEPARPEAVELRNSRYRQRDQHPRATTLSWGDARQFREQEARKRAREVERRRLRKNMRADAILERMGFHDVQPVANMLFFLILPFIGQWIFWGGFINFADDQ